MNITYSTATEAIVITDCIPSVVINKILAPEPPESEPAQMIIEGVDPLIGVSNVIASRMISWLNDTPDLRNNDGTRHKIRDIKFVRYMSGAGLKDSKTWCEQYLNYNSIERPYRG
jgi:hypothetical protein